MDRRGRVDIIRKIHVSYSDRHIHREAFNRFTATTLAFAISKISQHKVSQIKTHPQNFFPPHHSHHLEVPLPFNLLPSNPHITSAPTVPIPETLRIPQSFARPIRHTNVPNLIPDLAPRLARRLDRKQRAKQPIHPRADNEAHKEIQIIDIRRSRGDIHSDSANKPNNIHEDARKIRSVSSPVKPERVEIRSLAPGGVEFADLEITFADDVVVCNDHPSDG